MLDRVALITAPAGLRTAMVGAHALLKGYAPDIPEPGLAGFAPGVGPLWEAAQRLQDGKYFGAVANTGLAALDGLSVGAGGAGLKTTLEVAENLGRRAMTDPNIRKAARQAAGVTGRGWEAHHTIPFGGAPRKGVADWRNHPALIKVLPTATHRRLHGAYQNQPRFGPWERAWYGTTDWMKAGAAQVGARAADAIEHFVEKAPQPKAQGRKP